MWFRSLRIYRLSPDRKLDAAVLNERLAKRPLVRCASLQMFSRGWVYPRHEGQFLHAVNRHWLLALGVEQKLLPATVIRQTVQERAAAIEAEQGRKVGKKELRDMRERVTEELMPRAFTRRRTTWAWIDPAQGWLVVDAGSDARADEFMEVLIATLDDLHPRAVATQVSPSTAMTDWLLSGAGPGRFSVDSDLELRGVNDSRSAIRYVRHALAGKEIPEHIAVGKLATQLGMTWNDRISFMLTDKCQVKRLAFLDIIRDEWQSSAVSADEQFDVDFALMAGELAKLIPELIAALGGEQQPD